MTISAGKLTLVLLLILGIGSVSVFAQVQATNGSIQGDVADAAGAAVSDAAVEADQVDIQGAGLPSK